MKLATPQGAPIELNRTRADALSRRRRAQLHTRIVPALRAVGYALLVACCYFSNEYFGDPASNERLPVFAVAAGLYCLLSWLALDRAYTRLLPHDLGFDFLVADLFFFAWAVHVTGGDASWLIAIFLLRTADQVTSGWRPAIFFAHAGTATYLLLIAYMAGVEQRQLDWPLEMTKIGVLYAASFYIALTARTSDRRREQASAAIDLARGLISDLEIRTAELEAARSQAEAASVAKSEFMTNISHELRTPMNAIVGLLDLLTLARLEPPVQERLDALRASANELEAVIEEVLDFSRLEAAEIHLETRPTNPSRAVREVVRRLRHRAVAKGLQLEADLPPNLPEWVELDPSRLRQVLMQLVDNGIKFTDEGGVTVRVRRDPSKHYDLVFSVADTGVGFAAESADELFEAFTQADASLTRRHGGVGLGLALCRRLVELMGGQISLGNTPGGGTTVSLRLPARPLDPSHSSLLADTVEVTRARLLVVEDNPLNQEVMVAMLESLGLEVFHASNGVEALDHLKERRFDLVLMDCQMPVLDGYQATRELRRREGTARHTPVIAVTAHAMEGDRERCLAAGMDDYLPKPVTLDGLADAVGRWIEIQ